MLVWPSRLGARGGVSCPTVWTHSVATGYQNRLKVLYSQKATPGSSRKTCRYIPSLPDRILDAPEIRNDYCKCSLLFAHRMEEEGLGTRQTRKFMLFPFPALARPEPCGLELWKCTGCGIGQQRVLVEC